ncbi:hypothetical protein A3G54_01295 [Candidatus Giovannonibacteria bacterium RIFCSPLOWO2_12_FULL_44_15]|uniref:Uncharacterized protein n=1 Tax=Candidatus Giovannonibacteria bacterium RIFCSPLOWO2_12_FULL_44_15 TaxID=1798364 RepID=A0A1F5Y0F5_9BACT|nr:MAG: hypothetical protein A3G54_01295 [Candidatus Giovannonibacteria bacterium RIFCSPLOWO2_12_FULL_44_15]
MRKINLTSYTAGSPIIWGIIFLTLFYVFSPLPASAAIGFNGPLVPCGGTKPPADHPCQVCDLYTLARNIIDLLLWGIATPLLIVALLAAGFFWLTAGGSEEKISKGRSILFSAVVGFIIAFGAWVIINTILSTLAFKNPFDGSAWSNTGFCSQSPIK